MNALSPASDPSFRAFSSLTPLAINDLTAFLVA
jgi:hypothetical protein